MLAIYTDANKHYTLFLSTVVIIRLSLFIAPIAGPTIFGIRFHHYAFGLVGLLVAAILRSPTLYAVSLALVADELAYLVIGGRTHEDNYSAASLAGTLAVLTAAFFLRRLIFF